MKEFKLARIEWVVLAAVVAVGCRHPGVAPSSLATQERPGLVSRGEQQFTLLGPDLAVGQAAPGFTAVRTDGSEARLADFAGRTVIIAAVPSLDTPVCNLEGQRFNEEAARLEGVVVLVLSMDLPFAQQRWCGAHGIENLLTLSDHRTAEFSLKYGILIKTTRLMARSVFVVDPDGRIAYVEIVPQLGSEPNYEAALAAARQAAGADG